jgi:hypothetical protein
MAKKFLTGLNLVVLDTDPATGSEGELYFNSSASVAKIYQAGSWSILGAGGGGTTVSTTEPESPEIGDSWYKNDTGEFYVYDGTYWVEVNGVVQGESNLYTLSDVNITSLTDNEILAYDSSSSVWINKTADEAGIATTEDLSEYLTTGSAAILYQPFSVRLFNLTALEGAPGVLRSDGGLGWSLDPTEFLSTFNASSTYLTQVDASDIYLTQEDAENSYLTPASANSLYQPLDGDLTAIASLSGSSGFLKKNIFNDWVIDSNTYLTTYDASTIYQTTGNYATISGVETLSNKTMSSSFIDGTLTFNDIDYDHTISSASNNFTINAYQNLYLTTNTGSIILQPDEFVKIYNETVATQEWVDFQDYLTVSGASASYSQIDHNHTLDSLSNVEISGLVDGDAIVWSSASSAWINQVASGGGGGGATTTVSETSPVTPSVGDSWYKPSTGSFFIYDGSYWVEVTSVITIDPTDTLSSVTARGATTSDAITISNTTQSTTPTTGALIISGGLGVSKDVWIDGDLHVNGATATLFSRSLSTRDNLIYLNESSPTEITNAVGDGTYVTYTADNDYLPGESIRITGIDPAGYNISSGELKTIYSATDTEFVVEKTTTGTYVSGGDAYAKSAVNPDLGFAGGYNDGTYAHAGLFRDASDGVFKFFKGYVPEPDAAVNINTDHASFELADISVNDITALNATLSGSVSVGAIVSGSWSGDPISYSKGGTGLTSLGTSGQVLKVNSGATGLEWGTVDALPSQSGNNGKYLTTDGSTASWGTLDLSLYLTQSSASSTYATIVSPTLTTPNIGAATGTSLNTTGNVISHVDISTPTFVTNSYTITSTDDGKLLMLNNSTTAGNLLIPTDSTFNFPIGTQINVVQEGTGLITVGAVTPATTTINATPGKKFRAQWSSAAIVKTAANTWLLMGDLTV